jgi:hypothetical protein
LGEPLRGAFRATRVGLFAPSPAYIPLRFIYAGGSAAIPLAGGGEAAANMKYEICLKSNENQCYLCAYVSKIS